MAVPRLPVASLGGHSLLIFLLALAVLLGVALLFGRLARWLSLPAVAGELTAGVLLGPSVFGHAAPRLSNWLLPHVPGQMHLIDAIGELGVILLVGFAGISIDLGLLRRRAGTAARVGLGALLSPLAAGVAVGFALPATLVAGRTDRVTFAAFIGVAMCVSAIPVIVKTLLDMKLLHRNIGQLIISAATFDDIIGWLLLSFVSAMATSGLRAHHMLVAAGWLVGVCAFCLTLARPLTDQVLRLTTKSEDPGPMTAAVALLLLGFAALTQAVGAEAIIGALFGGMVISSSKWLDRERLAPLRTFTASVLAPVFFITAGLRMDLTALRRPALLGAAVLVLAVAVGSKFIGAYATARGSRIDHWDAVALGAGLNARGVMEVILAITGLQLGVLTTAMYTIIVLVAIITSVMAPPVLRYATRRVELTQEDRVRELLMAEPSASGQPELLG